MDCRVKPGNDEQKSQQRSTTMNGQNIRIRLKGVSTIEFSIRRRVRS